MMSAILTLCTLQGISIRFVVFFIAAKNRLHISENVTFGIQVISPALKNRIIE